MNLKKLLLIGALAIFACSGIFAQQQITIFGVVDTARIYETYFKQSKAVRDYETRKAAAQREVSRRTKEIKSLQEALDNVLKIGNDTEIERLQADITKKTKSLTDYTKAKNLELDKLKRNLQTNDAFYKKMISAIRRTAESEGYGMILSLQQDAGILWYSQSVDITSKVIKEMGLK